LVRGALAAIKASSLDGQTFNIVNKGEIQNNSGLSSDLAIIASGGAAAIDNRSLDTITGTIVLGAGDDAFTNSGTWRTAGGENLFGDGSDQVVNAIGGRIIAAQSATVAEATQFTALEGFSNRGTLSLNDGGAGDVTRVAGSFAGEGGTVRLDTELGGSSSKTDLLAIAGNTSGDTSLFVLNAGGSGALTTGDGIKVIEIAGISSGSFELGAPVIAGAYAYKLHRGGNGSAGGNPVDGDWYLRSFVENPDPDPEPPLPLYQPGVPIYETYPRLLQALNGTSSLWQRTGARYWSASGTQLEQGDGPGSATADEAGGAAKAIWTRIDGAHGRDRPDVSTAATRHDSDQWLLQSGLDGLLAETQAGGRLFGGVTVHYGQASADVRSRFGDGSIDSTGYGAGLTMTWLQQNGFYVDGQAQLTWFESDLGSSQLGSLVNDNDATGYALSLEAGRRIEVGGNWTITPQAQLVYSKVDFDTFTGPSSERVSLLDGDSLQGRIGVAVDHAANWYDDAGKPRQSRIYGIANLYREFLDGTAVNVSHVEIANKSDRVWGEIGLGGSYQWNGAYALYGEVTASTAFADFGDSYKLNGSVALRVSW
ncbi:MAG: autotransporter outer membrane beta-barrel domain-containing protein, partial [Phyllobacterium sp.]